MGKVRIILAVLAVLGVLAVPGAAQASQAANPVTLIKFTPANASGLPHTSLPSPKSVGNAALQSSNWAGYADAACSTCSLRYVYSQFNIPSVNCSATPNADVSEWVGLDGLSTPTVEQTGILGDCSGGSPSYYAWYEMYPSAAVYFSGVNPGDSITVSVYFNSSTNQFQLSLTDTTTGGSLNTSQQCPVSSCQRKSAEVITEAPSDSSGVVPLADFGTDNFTGSLVTSLAGFHGTLATNPGYWTGDSITMTGASDTKATPSALQGGQAFSVLWEAAS